MCTLIGIWKSVPGYDLVIGMNRDESASRAADPPSVIEGAPVIVAPRDRKAGGTWIGASGTGLVVALSNRRGRASATARSRGQLVLDALRQPNVAGVDVFLQREVREHEYNFWNLVDDPRPQQCGPGGERPVVRGRTALYDSVSGLSGSDPKTPESELIVPATTKKLSAPPGYHGPCRESRTSTSMSSPTGR